MACEEEHEIYVGGLSWSTSDRGLKDAFSCFGKILDARVIVDRFSGRSRGFGFITFANRRAMDNAIREMNGQELDQSVILVRKANSRMKAEYEEPGYLCGGRVSFKREARYTVHDECFNCGHSGHWAHDCPLVGRHRPSFSSRSLCERDDSEGSFEEDRDRYVDEQYDGRHFDYRQDKDGCDEYHHNDRVTSTRGTSNENSSCSHLVDSCVVGNVTVSLSSNIKECEKCKHYSYSLEDHKHKTSSFQNEDDKKGDSEACLSAVNFSQEDSRTMLATMVLFDELSLKKVESEKFQKFCQSLQPKFVIPSRITIIQDWFQIYLSKRKRLKNVLAQNCQRICLTIRTWTSIQEENYMVLTAHFVDNGWDLHERILNFCQISDCEGETIGKTTEKCLFEWGINKVFTITFGRESSDDAVTSYLREKFIAQDSVLLNGEFLYVRSSSHVFRRLINEAWKHLYKSILQIRNFVKNITSSPARLQTFRNFDKGNILPTEKLFNLDVPATWNSTYVLEAVAKFQYVFERIKDQDPKFFSEAISSLRDWVNICAFVKLLVVINDIAINSSAPSYVTPNEYFRKLCSIQVLIREYSQYQNDNPYLHSMIGSLQARFNKYWGNSNKTNFLLYVAVVLDPRYKLKFLKDWFREFWGDVVADKMTAKVKRILQKMCDEYFFNMTRNELNTVISPPIGSFRVSMVEKFKKFLDKEASNDCKMEVDNYLDECCHQRDDKDLDVLKWWKLNSSRFLILSEIAKDIFAIPLTTAAFQSTFKAEARVLDRFRSSFPPKILEALICAQNWLQSKPLTVDVGDEIEDIDKLDQEFSKIAMEVNLDSIAD